jgi:hypothetical protein
MNHYIFAVKAPDYLQIMAAARAAAAKSKDFMVRHVQAQMYKPALVCIL